MRQFANALILFLFAGGCQLLLFAPVLPVSAQAWGGCVCQNKPCSVVAIGEPTRVCFQIANGDAWNEGVKYIRPSFEPEADQYSRLYIPNSYVDLIQDNAGTIWNGTDITLGAASQDKLSFLRKYYDHSAGKVYPFLTAIISVDQGRVTGITWDNACIFCGGLKEACTENTYDFNGNQVDQSTAGQETKACWFKLEHCKQNAKACDLTFYVVWSGTDANGKALQSQSYRFSEFPAQELTDRLTQLVPTFGSDGRRLDLDEHRAGGDAIDL